MKAFFVILTSLLSLSAAAEPCQTTNLILGPSRETAEACSDLRTWGPATLTACSADSSELKIATGGLFEMKTTVPNAWVSKTTFSDGESGTLTQIFTLNLNSSTYNFHQMITDQRGHLLSHEICNGKIQVEN